MTGLDFWVILAKIFDDLRIHDGAVAVASHHVAYADAFRNGMKYMHIVFQENKVWLFDVAGALEKAQEIAFGIFKRC